MAVVTLYGDEMQLEGTLPQVGEDAPDFVLVDRELNNVSLATFGDTRKLIYTVPSLDTEVCAVSTVRFNQEASGLDPKTIVLIVSSDLPFAMKRFCTTPVKVEGCEEGPLEQVVTLSMMRSRDFARDYGVLITDGPLGGIIARSVLVLDANNKVVYTELVPSIEAEPDYALALEALRGEN